MSLNFKISELIHSDTAVAHNINNMPDINSLDCILDLIAYVLQPVREKLKKPMIITSGFRCPEVNKLVGGATNSQHLKGQAADFIVNGMSPAQIIDIIIDGCGQASSACPHPDSRIEFDQLINEYDRWVHISFNKGKNRRQVLKL